MAKTFKGKPCPQGHTERYATTKRCVTCAKAVQYALYDTKADTERKRAYRARIKGN